MRYLGNQRGSIVFSMMMLLSLTALLMGFETISLLRLKKTKALHECRTTALETQTLLAQAISRLFQLNPRAEALEEESRHWREVAATAPTPVEKAAATAHLARVTYLQFQLRFQQLAIMSTARLQATAKLGSWQSQWLPRATMTYPQLAVRPALISIAPPYETQIQFSKQQAIELKIHSENDFSEWIRCGATIERENHIWKVRMNADKSSSSLPF
jgi:hypothetical protein